MDEQAFAVIKKIFTMLNEEEPTERTLERIRGMLETLIEVYTDTPPEPEEERKFRIRLP